MEKVSRYSHRYVIHPSFQGFLDLLAVEGQTVSLECPLIDNRTTAFLGTSLSYTPLLVRLLTGIAPGPPVGQTNKFAVAILKRTQIRTFDEPSKHWKGRDQQEEIVNSRW